MNRVRVAVAATFVATTLSAGAAIAGQAATTTSGQPMQSVLAGKKLTPPIKGEAAVEYTAPVTKPVPGQNMVQTTIKVRNASSAPIARLKIAETWFDSKGNIVAGSSGVINGLLQPGEIQTVTIETPYNKAMNGNGYNFTHANGNVKPSKVKSLDDPKAATTTSGKAATTTAGKAATTTAGKSATTTAGKEPAAKPATAKK